MKRTTLALALTLGALPAFAEVQQIAIGSYADDSRVCELDSPDYSRPFAGISTASRSESTCEVSIPKFAFNQQYAFCALSGQKETKDDKDVWEHDFGSQCSFEIGEEEIRFRAVRGYGFFENSTSMLYCQFTCVGKADLGMAPAGTDLNAIISKPLAD